MYKFVQTHLFVFVWSAHSLQIVRFGGEGSSVPFLQYNCEIITYKCV